MTLSHGICPHETFNVPKNDKIKFLTKKEKKRVRAVLLLFLYFAGLCFKDVQLVANSDMAKSCIVK